MRSVSRVVASEASARARVAAFLFAAVVFTAVLATSARAGGKDDAFAEGYITAVMERELEIKPVSVHVDDGKAVIEVEDTEDIDVERLETLLSDLEAVQKIVVRLVPATEESETSGTPSAPAEAAPETGTPTGKTRESRTLFLPRGHLFEPLLADPRWPRFAASYESYFHDAELNNVAAVSLGGEFPLVRFRGPFAGRTQLGLQGGIFSIFDLDADSKDLVNADYRIGLPVTYARGHFTALARLFHQSSHLGDEFLLRNRVERVNLSYEAVDLMASYDFWHALRPYAGAGYLFDQDPSDLQPWWTQAGAEITSPQRFLGFLRPLLATDLQFHDENDWRTDVSLRAGVALENPQRESQRMYLLLEYYEGRNPNGQFFEREVEYAGVGIHGYF